MMRSALQIMTDALQEIEFRAAVAWDGTGDGPWRTQTILEMVAEIRDLAAAALAAAYDDPLDDCN